MDHVEEGAEADPLPLEKYCGHSLDTELIDRLKLDRGTVCEVSRLAVDDAFRRRAGEGASRYGDRAAAMYPGHERRTFPLICVSAFLAATALSEVTGRTNAFAMMEPFLPRMLRRSGILFRAVGAEIDYHGKRAPYFATLESVLSNMQADLRIMYDEILAQMQRSYRDKRMAGGAE